MTADGYALAKQLGLEAYYDAHGSEGGAYFLEDGRILKSTWSDVEAAVGLALMDLQSGGVSHPAVPRIHGVFWVEQDFDPSEVGFGGVAGHRYVILRDNFADFYLPDDKEDLFCGVLSLLNFAWTNYLPDNLEMAVRHWRPHGDEITSILSGLEWIHCKTEVRVHDIRRSNIGLSPSGNAGMRDLGCGFVPKPLLDRVKALDFEQIPSLSLSARP